jgi:hypothetical protein
MTSLRISELRSLLKGIAHFATAAMCGEILDDKSMCHLYSDVCGLSDDSAEKI